MLSSRVLATAKAWAALVGSVVTALLGIYGPDTPVGQVLTVIAAVATAVVVFRVPNQDTGRAAGRGEGGAVSGSTVAAVALGIAGGWLLIQLLQLLGRMI